MSEYPTHIHRCLKNRRVFFCKFWIYMTNTHRERQNSSNEEEKIETFIWYIAKFRYSSSSSSSSFPYIYINLIKLLFFSKQNWEKKTTEPGNGSACHIKLVFFELSGSKESVLLLFFVLFDFWSLFTRFFFVLFLMIFSLLLLLLSLLQSLISLATRTKCFLFFVFWSCLNFFVPFRFVVQFNTSPIGLVWFFFWEQRILLTNFDATIGKSRIDERSSQ